MLDLRPLCRNRAPTRGATSACPAGATGSSAFVRNKRQLDGHWLLGQVANQPLLDIHGQLLPNCPKPMIAMVREECDVGRSGSLQ
jgi:hypothetical protein